MTFLEICFLAAVSDDALKDKIGSIRPSHLQRSDAHRCSFAVVGTLGYSLKKYFSSQEKTEKNFLEGINAIFIPF